MLRRSYIQRWLVSSVILACSLPAWAVDPTEESQVSIGGVIDAYYAYDFNRPPGRNRAFTTQPLRHNEFNINLALVDVQYATDRSRGRFALQTGTYVTANYAAETPTLQRLHEGWVGIRLGRSDWWFDLGVFGSHIGFESAVTLDNWTYSRSLMADFSPFYESGLKISGPLSTRTTFAFLVLNGWQNIGETNEDKAIGTQLQIRPSDRALFNWSTFIGNEAPDSAPSQVRIFNNAFAQIQLSDRFDAVGIFDIGFQKKAVTGGYRTWYATALLARYQLTPSVRVVGRAEYFSDKDQVVATTGTPNGFRTSGLSVNLDYAVYDNVMLRWEVRSLFSKDRIFPTQAGASKNNGFIVMSLAMRAF